MSLAWGNPEEHTAAFREALEEFYVENPEEHRRFHEMGYDLQRVILGRQVQIYNQRRTAERIA